MALLSLLSEAGRACARLTEILSRLPEGSGEHSSGPTTPSVLDRAITITRFDNTHAATQRRVKVSLRKAVMSIARRTARVKNDLPLLKLAIFGNKRTAKRSLRHNQNLLSIDGVEVDYDKEIISFDKAVATLQQYALAAIVYTSASHTIDTPRWRILCPTSRRLPVDGRERLVARLNGIFQGVLAVESFTLSQVFYYGKIETAVDFRIELVEGAAIDLLSDLDSIAIGRDGRPYEEPAGVRELELPAAIIKNNDPESEQVPIFLKSLLDAIPIVARDDRQECWLPVGMAVHHETSGSRSGFALWDSWSRLSPKYDEADQCRVWDSFGRQPDKPITIGTLRHLVARLQAEHGIPEVDRRRTSLNLLSPSECAASAGRPYIVKGLLAQSDLGCIFGQPGTGKSLVAPHIGYMVALGRPAFGMRTLQGKVLYVAAEDSQGMKGRITALLKTHGDAENFRLIAQAPDLRSEEGLLQLLDTVKTYKPTLIFLDTLAMSFPGLEENASEAMGEVVRVGKQLAEDGAGVILVHHDTKAEGSTPRGHSVLNGALDVALKIGRDEDRVRGSLTKNRNGSCDQNIAFRVGIRELGVDQDGEPMTAAYVQELSSGRFPMRQKLTSAEQTAMEILHELLAEGGGGAGATRCLTSIPLARWQAVCITPGRVSSVEKIDSRKKAFQRAMKGLSNKHYIEIWDDQVAILGRLVSDEGVFEDFS